MEYELKRINIWSVVKIVFIVSFAIGTLIGVFYAFIFAYIGNVFQNIYIGEFGLSNNSSLNSISIFFLIMFFATFISLFHSVLSVIFVGGYNLISSWIGGAKFELHLPEESNDEIKIINTDEIESYD